MRKQSHVFLEGEAKCWYERNKDRLSGKNDPVLQTICDLNIHPKSVLEVGCSNGWRLDLIEAERTYGVDPMGHRQLRRGAVFKSTAKSLGAFNDAEFDLVIYGWCLYLCDREDLFRIVSEGDRVLHEGGLLLIHDFHPSDDGPTTYKRKYHHMDGLYSYKMDHSLLWLANPAYRQAHKVFLGEGENLTSITILQKNTNKGWPLHD